MRFLHTSDWHLGQKFVNQSREAEHKLMLEWLLQTIENEQIDCLLVSGDIYDVNNPPVSAEEMYYGFLANLRETGCKHAVITGGNHDLPSRLQAPAGLLKALDVHVRGAATENLADEIIELKNKAGEIVAIVAAVPFLRDRDLRVSIAGESIEDRMAKLKAGILRHFQEVGEAVAALKTQHLPVKIPSICMGHLFAKGASASEEQNNIYIGNLENIASDGFSEVFDYVALGHIHRPQIIGKKRHVRYSGSPIPLSFSELRDKKVVLVFDLDAKTGLSEIREIAVPVPRKLLALSCVLNNLSDQFTLINQANDPLPAWVDLTITDEIFLPNLDGRIAEIAANFPKIEILKKRQLASSSGKNLASEEIVDLASLEVEEIFLKKIENLEVLERNELLATFRELRDQIV